MGLLPAPCVVHSPSRKTTEYQKVLFLKTPRACVAVVAAALFFLAGPKPVAAQSGSGVIAGSVTDASGRSLGGVLVLLDNARSGAATERDGSYRVTRVPAGPHRVTFRYIGFAPQTIAVTVRTGETASQNVKLLIAATNLAAVLVTGQVAGQAAALNQQRAWKHLDGDRQ